MRSSLQNLINAIPITAQESAVQQPHIAFDKNEIEISEFGKLYIQNDSCIEMTDPKSGNRINAFGNLNNPESPSISQDKLDNIIKRLNLAQLVLARYNKALTDKLASIQNRSEPCLLSADIELIKAALQKSLLETKARAMQVQRLIDLALNPLMPEEKKQTKGTTSETAATPVVEAMLGIAKIIANNLPKQK